jgi:hypothetical protein
MGVNFPDTHCRLAFGESVSVPENRTGMYLDTHSLLTSPRNVIALATRNPGFVRYIDRQIMAADPRLDIEIAYRTLKRAIARTWQAWRP